MNPDNKVAAAETGAQTRASGAMPSARTGCCCGGSSSQNQYPPKVKPAPKGTAGKA